MGEAFDWRESLDAFKFLRRGDGHIGFRYGVRPCVESSPYHVEKVHFQIKLSLTNFSTVINLSILCGGISIENIRDI